MKRTSIRTIVSTLALVILAAGAIGEWPYLGLGSISAENSTTSQAGTFASTPGVHIVDSDGTGIVLELYTPDFQVELRATEDITCDQLGVTDYAIADKAGWPALPVRGAMLGVPPHAEITLSVLDVEAEMLSDRYELCPVPSPIIEMELSGEVNYGGEQLIRDEQAYATDALWPAAAAELVDTGFIRSQRVAQVRFHPFQYNPAAGTLRHLERIRVRLDFNRDSAFGLDAAIGAVDEGLFEKTLSRTLLNYDAARHWRSRPTSLDRQDHMDWPLPAQTGPGYKIMVDEDGIYEITYADLQAAGIATATLDSLDPHTFQMYDQGQEVAIYVPGEEDSSFDSEDALVFYGQKMDTKYTDTNVYWLTWGDANGKRMTEVDGTPIEATAVPTFFLTTTHLEENTSYFSNFPSGTDNDHWYWNYIFATGSPLSSDYVTNLSSIATNPFSATVRGLFRGYSATPEHHSQVYLNGHLIDEATWPPMTEHFFETDVPHTYLSEGTNTISVTCGIGNDQDIILINWFEIDYLATYAAKENFYYFDGDQAGIWKYQVTDLMTDTLDIFDLTPPISPTRILSATIQSGSGTYTLTFQHAITEEHRYLALPPTQRLTPKQIERDEPSNLRTTTNSADYVIITHSDFYTDVLPLADHRISQGTLTVVVDVQDVYDEFGYGIFNPVAIRDFLAYAYANWSQPAPALVLLVGDGNYDFKNHMERDEPNYIPPYLADVDLWIGETAADNRYACVSGGDIMPDIHIGRLPVKTSAEASATITKIMDYEQYPPPGDWNQKPLFVSDDPDSGGDFYALSDAIADHYVPAPYLTQKVYHGVSPYITEDDTRTAIINSINEGRLIVNYIGHGALNSWSVKILRASDLNTLTNDGQYPLMTPMTCLEGYFIHPSSSTNYSSLGESIVRIPDKGAIASWSPTGLGIATGHDYLNRGLFEALFFNDIVTLGPATTQGKLYLYTNSGGYRDLLDTYVLFGDPALALNVLEADVGISKTVDAPKIAHPGDTVIYTLTYTNAGPATAHHVVITDTLATGLLSPTVTHTGATITQRSSSRFVWDVVDLAAGEGGIITITAIVSPTFLTGVFSNTATIATTAVESDLENNTSTAPDIVTSPHVYYFPIIYAATQSYDATIEKSLRKRD